MNWHSLSDFLAMGGHGLYVWGSFAMVAAVLAAELLLLKAQRLALARALQHDADFGAANPHGEGA